jgi:hypothetical protein
MTTESHRGFFEAECIVVFLFARGCVLGGDINILCCVGVAGLGGGVVPADLWRKLLVDHDDGDGDGGR